MLPSNGAQKKSGLLDRLNRPMPPIFHDPFMAALEVTEWIGKTFIEPSSPLYNPEHDHLRNAEIGCVWTNVANKRRMHMVAAMAEVPAIQGNRWVKGRSEQQLIQWFGLMPDFIITFDVEYAKIATDVQWCALVEHELYHCGQAINEYGVKRFRPDGRAVFAMRGHDVEEFVGVVQRYGIEAAGSKAVEFVKAAAKKPQLTAESVKNICGSCG